MKRNFFYFLFFIFYYGNIFAQPNETVSYNTRRSIIPYPITKDDNKVFYSFWKIFDGRDSTEFPLAKLDSLVRHHFNNDSIWCSVCYRKKDKKYYYFSKESIRGDSIVDYQHDMVYIKVAFWELIWNRFIKDDIDINYKYPKDYKSALEIWEEIFPHMFRCNVNGAMKICYDVDYNKIIKQNPKLHLCKKDEYLKRAKQGYLKIKIPKP